MCARTEAGPTGGGGAWPGFNTTHPATHEQRSAAGVEGAGGSGGHGRASRRGAERSEALASRAAGPSGARNTSGATSINTQRGRLAGGPPPTGTHSGRALRRPEHQRRPAHQRRPEHPWGHTLRRNTSGATRHLGITKPPGPTGAGRLSQDQRLTAGPRRCRGLRGRSPGERWKYQAWRQRPSRSPPCGDPRRRRWRSAWPSRQRSRRRCPRSRPG